MRFRGNITGRTGGSAYVFVLIMSMIILMTLAVTANITAYEAKVSAAYTEHSNLSLLAHAGVTRAVHAINSELRGDATVAERVMARLHEADYLTVLAEEAARYARERFDGTQLSYGIETDGAQYSVTVRITSTAEGFSMESAAAKAGLATGESVTAQVVWFCDATAVVLTDTHTSAVLTGEFGYGIGQLTQNR